MVNPICTTENCLRAAEVRGFCKVHYNRARLRNEIPRLPVIGRRERLMSKFKPLPNGCWEWLDSCKGGRKGQPGYGAFQFDGVRQMAHRAVYEEFKGDIPAGLQLDHLCRNTRCVNPDHLEPVTIDENLRRGEVYWAKLHRDGQCRSGHPFSGDNVIVLPSGRRRCRACAKAYRKKRYATQGC